MPHHHLGLQSLDGFQSNADNDDDGGTADAQVGHTGHELAGHDGQQSDDSQINGTKDDDLIDNLLDELSGGPAGTEAGNETSSS